MTTVTINLPLPPVHCKPNQRTHWRYTSAAIKEYRAEAFYATRALNAAPFVGLVTISATFYMARKRGDARYRPLDCGNAISSLKAATDGIVDAGLLADDNHRCLTWGAVRLLHDKAEHGGRAGVVVTLAGAE